MGDDQAIVRAARISYGDGTKTVSDDDNLIRYLIRHRHCYVGSMEVLTSEGWKRWDELGERAFFFVPNPDTRQVTVENLKVKHFDSPSQIYSAESDRFSYAVTDRHTMWFKDKYRETFEKFKIEDMPKWGHFDPFKGYSLIRPEGLFDIRLMFVGFFLGDGNWSSPNTITFHLKKQRKIEYLQRLINELSLTARDRIVSLGASNRASDGRFKRVHLVERLG